MEYPTAQAQPAQLQPAQTGGLAMQSAQAQALRTPQAGGVPYDPSNPGRQYLGPAQAPGSLDSLGNPGQVPSMGGITAMLPGQTGAMTPEMQAYVTPLDPNGGMQMSMPQSQPGLPPMTGRPGQRPEMGWQPGMQMPGRGFGMGGRFGGPNGMRPQMQGMPGQVAPLRPQGTAPQPAGAALPATPGAAPNLGMYR